MNNKFYSTHRTALGKISDFLRYAVLSAISLFAVFPFLWMFLSALKTKDELMRVEQLLPQVPQWENFSTILFDSPIPSYMANSLLVAVAVVVLQVVTGAMLAYALVFFDFKGKNLLFAIIMGIYMLPSAVTYIPGYIILSEMNLLNKLTGIIISSTVSIFGIFLLRTGFMQVPKGLVEAARMDGASHFRILWEIVCPVSKSSFITFGLMSFISTYNSYMWPFLITNDSNKFLVSQGLRSFLIEGGAYGTKWNLVMAASAVIVLPLLVLFAFTQKWFINGIGGDTGMKG